MRSSPFLFALCLSLPALLSVTGCTVIQIDAGTDARGVRAEGLVDGYATVGWATDPPFVRLDLLRGRSPGALAAVDLWYLARAEVGLLGASAGVGPFDFGIGTLFYEPRSPAIGPTEEKEREEPEQCGCGDGCSCGDADNRED